MVWARANTQGNEVGKIRWELVPYTRGKGLDVGCGPVKAFPHFIGVDNGSHNRQFGIDSNENLHIDCTEMPILANQSMDFVFSSHLLEHIDDHVSALKEWWRLIKTGGYLCLYLPHKDFYPNIGQPGCNPDHKHDFLPQDIIEAMKEVGFWDLVANQERNGDEEYSFFQVYKKTNSKHRFACNEPKPEKTCAVVRYGAFGDLMMASSIFPALKADGYHITLYTSVGGEMVVRNDHHIDKIIVQDTDQIPNSWLGEFWKHLGKKYEKFINLSETVEGRWLPVPGHREHGWTHAMRHKYLDNNYLEFTHEIAGVPYKPAVKFYATESEKEWARKERSKMGDFVILWSLSGSSVHKSWPHLDAVIAALMINHRSVDVVLVGDELCQLLEAGWEKEPRVHLRSGRWSIRESMTFIGEADCLVGCETGLLNAASFMSVPKVVTLSHSSINNLTRDWVNTTALEPKTACYPCHQMHYGFEFCHQEETTGCAQCQFDIGADQMLNAIQEYIEKWQRRAA